MIDLRQLEALTAVAAEGSVTRAARTLGWSQPTVDYHLKNLEQLVGAAVLQRSTRGSTLTQVGALLVDRGSQILTLSERALEDAKELSAHGLVRLRFGAFPTAAAKLLPHIVDNVERYGIELDAQLAESVPLVADLNQRRLDAALVYSAPGHELPFRPGTARTEVLHDPLMLAIPEGHPLEQLESIDLDTLLTLSDERWLFGSNPGDPMDTVLIDTFAAAGRTPNVTIRSDDVLVMLGMVAAGMVISLFPRLAIGNEHPGVTLRPIDVAGFSRTLILAAPGEGPDLRPSAAVNRLAAAVRAAIASTAK